MMQLRKVLSSITEVPEPPPLQRPENHGLVLVESFSALACWANRAFNSFSMSSSMDIFQISLRSLALMEWCNMLTPQELQEQEELAALGNHFVKCSQVLLGEGYYADRTSKQTVEILKRRGKYIESQIENLNGIIKDLKFEASFFDKTATEAAVPWSNERPLENKELNAIIGAWERTGVDSSNRDWLHNRFSYVSIMEIPPLGEWFQNHSLWAILTSFYGFFVVVEVPYTNSYLNDMLNQDVQEMTYFEQTHIIDFPDNKINSDSNIIPYSQYLQETQNAGIQDTNSFAPNDLLVLSLVEQMTDQVANLDKENQINKMVNESLTAELERYKERVAIFEQRINADSNNHEKLIDSQMDDLILKRNAKFAAFQQDIDTLKKTLSKNVKEKESLSKTLTVFKIESKEKESKYIDKEIVLEKQNKELENIICKMYRSTQAMHMLMKPQVFYDDTHKQALGYQNPFHLKKSQQIKPTLYDGSVIAKEHAVISVIDEEETLILEEDSRSKMLDKQNDPISIEKKIKIYPIDYSKLNNIKEVFAPRELPKVSLVNESLKKLRYQLASFDKVMKKEPHLMLLQQCFVDKNDFETQIKQLRIDNDQLLNQIMSQEIMHIAMNSVDILNVNMSCMNECCKCLELESELLKKKDFIEKEVFDKLVKSYSTLEKHCNSLELSTQLNQEIFQKENSSVNQNAPTFN
ncbi:retrovirus-related pol polyprotein from transposon TNT 1-94 [Tanacetum coccineum]